MKELLKRWAELEPTRCRFNTGIPAWTDIDTGDEIPEVPDFYDFLVDGAYLPDYSGLLQIAVQQAIEARGWSCTISINKRTGKNGSKRRWSIYRCDIHSIRHPRGKSETSPAAALLSAYIQALEATI